LNYNARNGKCEIGKVYVYNCEIFVSLQISVKKCMVAKRQKT